MIPDNYVCPVCGNSDPKTIGYLKGKPYCRKCISFKGEYANNTMKAPSSAQYKLSYSLSNDQKRLSNQLILNYKKGINSLVHAVCGSGKTEIVLEVIKYAIECGDRVGFAIPRRDVVIELHQRFSEIFKRNKIALVYGGHTQNLSGDLICLTTHQLYRYENYFDLLIVDEVDAFPFKGDEVLNSFFERAIKGKYILLSATPHDDLINKFKGDGFEILYLHSRFHGHPLPVPKTIVSNRLILFGRLISFLIDFTKDGKQVFIFTPTIGMCETYFKLVTPFIKHGSFVHSKCGDREKRMQDFKDKKYMYLFTTAVLERGVTVKDLQVIVCNADHSIYDKHALIQIAGRVGRKKDAPEGKVIFLAKKLTRAIQDTISDIEKSNESLQSLS